jgi:LPXTG-motif cell wall-anchored protein
VIRPLPALGGAALAGAVAIGFFASPAYAAPALSTVTFAPVGTQETWTVPDGVTSITATLAAGSGHDGILFFPDSTSTTMPGGSGAVLHAEIPVTPGERLLVLVGREGDDTLNAGGGEGTFLASPTRGLLAVAGGGGSGPSEFAGYYRTSITGGEGGAGGTTDGSASTTSAAATEMSGGGATQAGGGAGGQRPSTAISQLPIQPCTTPRVAIPGSGGSGPAAVVGGTIVPGPGGLGGQYGDFSDPDPALTGKNSPGGAGGGSGYFGGGGGSYTDANCGGTIPTFDDFVGPGGGGSGYLVAGATQTGTGTNDGDGSLSLSYDTPNGISISDDRVAPGDKVTVTVTGLDDTTDYDIVLHSTPKVLARVTTDAAGSFSQTVTIPDGTPAGAHTITVGGLSGRITVVELLAATGSEPHTAIGAIGATLLLVGGAAILLARRRRRIA